MRAPLATLLGIGAVALVAAAWLATREVAPAPTDGGAAEVAAPVAPEVPTPARAARTEPDSLRGVIRGRIVDRTQAPIPGARAQVMVDDRADGLPFALADGDGRFVVFGVPLAPCALRAEAAGMPPAQLGDLRPDRAPDRTVDAGTITLDRAASYHGRVLSRGRGLAGARLVLAPALGAPGSPTPVVQQATSDADGHFFFAVAPPPECFLGVAAAGHRARPPLAIRDERESLQVELSPLASARGRVVDRATGAAVAGARVWSYAVPPDATGPLAPRADLDAADATAVGADGAFEVELADAARACLQVEAPGFCALVHDPLDAGVDHAGLVLAVEPGSAVRGRVTFRGEPVAARASLRPDGADAPTVVRFVGDDGALALGPTPPGEWILRVDADVGARHEQRLRVSTPTEIVVDVALAEGSMLAGVARLRRDATALVVCTHASGLQRRALVGRDGAFTVEGLFPGRWRARIDQGDEAASRLGALLVDLLDDDGFDVGAAPPARMDVAANELRLGRIDGFADARWAGQSVALVAADDRQRRVPAGLRRAQVDAGGRFTFDPALPGVWLVTLGDAIPPLRTTTVVVEPGVATVCTFGP